jgi:catechol 2,3-dioxygenase-like lactoylglutathione lyase family enzyme
VNESRTEDFYPMPTFVTLEVADIAASTAWYADALGFRPVFEAPGPAGQPSLVHLRRDRYQDILLVPAATAAPTTTAHGVTVNFLPGETSVDDIARRATGAASLEVEGPLERPWNVREVTVHDPDGYRLRCSEPIDVTKTFKEVVGQDESGADRTELDS